MFKMVILLTADNGLAVQFADFYKCLVLCYNAFLLNCRFSFFFCHICYIQDVSGKHVFWVCGMNILCDLFV